MEYIKFEIYDQIAKITINRENALNALNSKVLDELDKVIDQAYEKLSDFRVLVITGAGEKSFVAGADISEMVNLNTFEARSFLSNGQRILDRIENFPRPVVALINGFALGGGFELALACDIRIATDNALIGLPEVTLGLIPSFGGTQRLTRVVGSSIAKSMILFGKKIKADKALQLGIIDQIISNESKESELNQVLITLKSMAPKALTAAKYAINAASETDMTNGQMLEVNLASMCFSSADLKEGMTAFLEKRIAEFKDK
jgi:enoyl-CoA hydratase